MLTEPMAWIPTGGMLMRGEENEVEEVKTNSDLELGMKALDNTKMFLEVVNGMKLQFVNAGWAPKNAEAMIVYLLQSSRDDTVAKVNDG